jgi:hypothetical protein
MRRWSHPLSSLERNYDDSITRFRKTMTRSELEFLPVGTTANEAFGRELKDYTLGQQMHQATLELKLIVMRHAKLLAHNSALYFPTTVQIKKQAHVLARVVSGSDPWEKKNAWSDWCRELRDGAVVNKAVSPLAAQRRSQAARLSAWRGGVAPMGKAGKTMRKRTVLRQRKVGWIEYMSSPTSKEILA